MHIDPSCLVLKPPYALASKNPLPAVALRMIDFVEETPPLRRQRVEHFRRKIGFVVPDIDVIITENERHARIVLLPHTRGVPHPLGKN